MSVLGEGWRPEFGAIYTWFAMDKKGRIAVMVNNCFGDLPKVLLQIDGVEALLDRMSEFVWEESTIHSSYPDNKKGQLQVDLYSAWRYRNYDSFESVFEQISRDWCESGVTSEANLSINKGCFVYHGVEGDSPGVDYPVGYEGGTGIGDYFRYLVPTIFSVEKDFPSALRKGFVVSDTADFMSDRLFYNKDINMIFTKMHD